MVTYQDSTDATAGDEPVESRAGRLRGEEPAIKRRRHYTIRHYERLGLIEPYRGKGDIRYFSPDDIDKLMQIRRLVDELGVNLAGVEVILNMREQMRDAQAEYEHRIEELREQYEGEIGRLKEMIRRMQGE